MISIYKYLGVFRDPIVVTFSVCRKERDRRDLETTDGNGKKTISLKDNI